MDSPCRFCHDRHLLCHADCEKYLAVRAMYEKAIADRHKARIAKEFIFDGQDKANKLAHKRRRK